MNKLSLITLFFSTSLMLSGCSDGDDDNTTGTPPEPVQPVSYDFSSLRNTVSNEMSNYETTAVSVAISKDGEVVFAETFGNNYAGGAILAEDTQFQIGSTSKLFTAMAILKLEEMELLNIEDDLLTHMPDLAYSPEFADYWSDIQIHELLSQQSGLEDWNDFSASEVGENLQFFATQSYPTRPPLTRAGYFHSYSNPNYILLGALIERLSGQSFAGFVSEQIFGPLDMLDTTMNRDSVETRNNYALGTNDAGTVLSTIQDVTLEPVGLPVGSGTWSTPQDMLKAAHFLLNGNDSILAAQNRAKITGKQIPLDDYTASFASYGYGMGVEDGIFEDIDEYYPVQIWQHDGGTAFYSSQFYMFPEHGIAISILANNNVGDYANTIKEVLSVFDAMPEPVQAPLELLDSSVYDEYTGTYSGISPWGEISVNITSNGDSLVIEIPVLDSNGGGYQSELIPMADTTLTLLLDDDIPVTLTFRNVDSEPGMDLISNRNMVLHRVGFEP